MRSLNTTVLSSISLAALMASPAFAQATPAAPVDATPQKSQDNAQARRNAPTTNAQGQPINNGPAIVVTGSRIRRDNSPRRKTSTSSRARIRSLRVIRALRKRCNRRRLRRARHKSVALFSGSFRKAARRPAPSGFAVLGLLVRSSCSTVAALRLPVSATSSSRPISTCFRRRSFNASRCSARVPPRSMAPMPLQASLTSSPIPASTE